MFLALVGTLSITQLASAMSLYARDASFNWTGVSFFTLFHAHILKYPLDCSN